MPTNDERREVAVKLRDMACRANPSWPALMDLLKCPGRAVAVQYLADLIEPEPERTCRNIASEADREWGNPFICSECGADPHDAESYYCGFSSGEHDWRFCPSCGAKVVHDA